MADQEDADRREPEGDGDDELRAALGDLLSGGDLGEDPGDDDVDHADVERHVSAADRHRVELDDHFDLSALEDAVAELGLEVDDEPPAPSGEPSTQDGVEPSGPSPTAPSSPTGRHVGLDLTELPSPPGRPAPPPVDHDDEPAPFEFSSSEPMPFLISADEVDDEPQRPAREPALPGKGPSAPAGLPPEDLADDPEPLGEPAPTGRKMPPLGQASAADLFGEEEDDGWEPVAPGALGSRGAGDDVVGDRADVADAAGDAEATDEAEGRRTRGRGRRGFSLRRGRGAREAESSAPDALDDDATPALEDHADHERHVDARDDEPDRPDEVAARDDEPDRPDEVAARAEVDQIAHDEVETGRYDAPLRVEDEPADQGASAWGTPPDDWDDLDLDAEAEAEAEATPDVDRHAAAPTTDEVVAFTAHRGRLSGDVSSKARKLFGR